MLAYLARFCLGAVACSHAIYDSDLRVSETRLGWLASDR